MIGSKRYSLVKDGNVKRIIATEDIIIPGDINIEKRELGGIIDGNINIRDDVDIWVSKSSKIEGDFSISNNLFVMNGSILRNTTNEELTIGTDTMLIGSTLTDVTIQKSSYKDCINSITIYFSKIANSYIIPGYSMFKVYDPVCCYIRNSTISKSNIIGRFDITRSYISESTVRNIIIRQENQFFKKTCNLTEIYKSDIYFDSVCDIVDLRQMIDSSIVLDSIHILNFMCKNFDHLYMNNETDFFYITNIGSRADTTFFYKRKIDNHFEIFVSCGCFEGNIDDFIIRVKKTHKKGSKYWNQYLDAISIARNIIEIK